MKDLILSVLALTFLFLLFFGQLLTVYYIEHSSIMSVFAAAATVLTIYPINILFKEILNHE